MPLALLRVNGPAAGTQVTQPSRQIVQGGGGFGGGLAAQWSAQE